MMATTAGPCEWEDYLATDFVFAEYPAGARVLDVGFGGGEQMAKLGALGCHTYGLEYDANLAAQSAARGLKVCRGQAERLPFLTGSLDGVVCKVVVPYTDEAAAIAEIARVLRPGGTARVSYHGLGYSLKYLLTERNWKRRVYAARTIVNTWIYALTGRRLPRFWGDTLYQSARRLRRYYQRSGLEVKEWRSGQFAGAPVFIYHILRRTSA